MLAAAREPAVFFFFVSARTATGTRRTTAEPARGRDHLAHEDPWTRLLQTVVGTCWVDFHRATKVVEPKTCGDVDVPTFVDFALGSIPLKAAGAPALPGAFHRADPLAANPAAADLTMPALVRVESRDGSATKPFDRDGSSKRARAGADAGPPVEANCWACTKHAPCGDRAQATSFACPRCEMPLCSVKQSGEHEGRPCASCHAEHMRHGLSSSPARCTGVKRTGQLHDERKVPAAQATPPVTPPRRPTSPVHDRARCALALRQF